MGLVAATSRLARIEEPANRRAPSDEGVDGLALGPSVVGDLAPAQQLAFEDSFDDDQKRRKLHRLGEEVDCPRTHGPNCKFDRCVTRKDDDGEIGIDGKKPWDQVDASPVGDGLIENGQVRARFAAHPQRGFARIRLAHLVPVRFQKPSDAKAHGDFVVDEENALSSQVWSRQRRGASP